MRKKNKVCNIGFNIFISLLNMTLKNGKQFKDEGHVLFVFNFLC